MEFMGIGTFPGGTIVIYEVIFNSKQQNSARVAPRVDVEGYTLKHQRLSERRRGAQP